jgi:hypothetical protein
MRFSIRHLLLLAPLFLLNTFLISVFALPPLRTYRYQHEVNGVQYAQERIETALRHFAYDDTTVSDKTLNHWLAHCLPSTDPASAILMDPPRLDSWGNPYRIQARKSEKSPARLYSTGRDGNSQTDGNDLDDIRSWDENRASWYRDWQYRREIGGCMILSVIITPIAFWFLANLTGFGNLKPPPGASGG